MKKFSEHQPFSDEQIYPLITLTITAAISVASSFIERNKMDSAIALWLLGLMISFSVLFRQPHKIQKDQFYSAWILISAAVATAFLAKHNLHKQAALLLLLLAVISYQSSLLLTAKMILPGIIFIMLVPNAAVLHYALGAPLSKICTMLSSHLLNVFGIKNYYEGSIILIDNVQVAVTTACSGIDLLEGIMLISFIIVYFSKQKFIIKVIHFFSLIPLLIIFNTLRLTVAVMLAQHIGMSAYTGIIHAMLGYSVVIFTAAGVFWIGKLLKNEASDE